MKKILVPIDGSAASQKAAAHAFKIAKDYKSEVVVFNVYVEPDISMYNDVTKLRDNLVETESKILDSALNNINTEGVSYTKKIVSGVAYERILEEAKDGDYDLIVMGQRGFSKIKRFFVGSQTVRVISDATCPVLVVHE